MITTILDQVAVHREAAKAAPAPLQYAEHLEILLKRAVSSYDYLKVATLALSLNAIHEDLIADKFSKVAQTEDLSNHSSLGLTEKQLENLRLEGKDISGLLVLNWPVLEELREDFETRWAESASPHGTREEFVYLFRRQQPPEHSRYESKMIESDWQHYLAGSLFVFEYLQKIVERKLTETEQKPAEFPDKIHVVCSNCKTPYTISFR